MHANFDLFVFYCKISKMKNILSIAFIVGIIVFVGISLTEKGTQRVPRNLSSTRESSPTMTPTGENLTAVGDEFADIKCDGKPTISLTEGPYYKEGSPERINIRSDDSREILTLSGYVLDTDCEPIQNAWLDFWQTDAAGNYDNKGYKFRGHQYTDTNGFYILETAVPAEYPGRTPHIHVKLRATEESPIVVTQLFLPNAAGNTEDQIFDKSLIIKLTKKEERMIGSYNFVLDNDL